MQYYADSFFIIVFIISTVVIQALVAPKADKKQPHFVSGTPAPKLEHHAVEFGRDHGYKNLLGHVPLFVVATLLAMFAGVDANILYVVTSLFATARVVQMGLLLK